MWLTWPTHLTHSRKWAKSCETCIPRAARSAATCNRTQRQPMPKYRPTPPEQPKGVHNDEEKSFDWGDVAEDSSDREQASGLQALLAASPENLTDDAIDYTAAADPELASEPGTLQEGTFFRGTFDGMFTPEATAVDRRETRPGRRLRPTSSCRGSAFGKGPWTALQQHPAPHRPPVG